MDPTHGTIVQLASIMGGIPTGQTDTARQQGVGRNIPGWESLCKPGRSIYAVTRERDLPASALTPPSLSHPVVCFEFLKGPALFILNPQRMLSGKFFAIASAILAAAVNASPVEVAKRDTQAVRSPCIAPPRFLWPCHQLGSDTDGFSHLG